VPQRILRIAASRQTLALAGVPHAPSLTQHHASTESKWYAAVGQAISGFAKRLGQGDKTATKGRQKTFIKS